MTSQVRTLPPPLAGTVVDRPPPDRSTRRALVIVRLAVDGRPRAVHERLVEALRTRVLDRIAVNDGTEPVLFLDDGVAVVAALRAGEHSDDLSERVRHVVTGRVRATTRDTTMDITVVPRLEVAGIVEPPRPPGPAHGAALRRAITEVADATSISVRYAPVVHAAREDLRAIIATPTWDHPVHGRVGAHDLRRAAQVIGETGRFDRLLVSHACADLQRLIRSRGGSERLAVHVPVDDSSIADRRYVHHVVDLIRLHRHHPAQITLSVDGTGFVSGGSEVVDGVRALRRIGVRISVDTIGTAGAGLATITHPGADVLRIGSVLLDRRSDADVATALVELARATGADALGCDVDHLVGLRRARAAGVDLVHGAAIGPPEDIAALTR